MRVVSPSPKILLPIALLAGAASVTVSAQEQEQPEQAQDGADSNVTATVYGTPPSDLSQMEEGPEVKGIISARSGDRIQVTADDGSHQVVSVTDQTRISGNGGFLGLGRNKLAGNALLNGLPVSIKTVQQGGGLYASRITLQNKDLRTASMIRSGTNQRFEEQAAATEALRGRMGDIDQYNIKGTTNVNFAIGQSNLTPEAQSNLCAAASQANSMDNALLLVVGYADSTGDQEFNQVLSERRASRVVNYLQQACGWKPYRMLTPTGMAEADPLASNDTAEGRAQNRRVSVNILVSKAVDGI